MWNNQVIKRTVHRPVILIFRGFLLVSRCQKTSKFLIPVLVWDFNPFRVGVKTVLTPSAPVPSRGSKNVPPGSKTDDRGRLGRKTDANFFCRSNRLIKVYVLRQITWWPSSFLARQTFYGNIFYILISATIDIILYDLEANNFFTTHFNAVASVIKEASRS